LTKLAEIASGIEMLEWEDANLLGRYYLRELPDIERIAAEKALPRFRGWSRFLAALSDSIPAGRLSPQDALSMMQLAKGEDVQYRDPAVWRDEFSVFFKQLAIDALDRALAGHVADERQAWFTLKEYLYVSYFARGSLMGRVPSWARERELSPLFLATFVFEDPTVARERLPGQESYLDETFASEMARDVFAQQLFAERLLVRLENFNGNQDETPSGAEDSELNMGSPTLGETLLAQEQRLLIRLRQMRREMFDELMKTGRIPGSKVQ
jgi:hypothetical protein